MGEVGDALKRIFPDAGVYDTNPKPGLEKVFVDIIKPSKCDMMHICFPYSKDFTRHVFDYQVRYSPGITVIHSSVPVGTSDTLRAVYSPVRGVHPNLELGMRTITKYFAGLKAGEVAAEFYKAGVPVRIMADTRSLEAAKLWDTTAYGLNILLEKEIWKYCRENQLDYEIVYREFTQTYNMGFKKLGMPHVQRPWLMHAAGKIGGHCVVPNAALLDSPSAKRLVKENSKL